MHIEYRSDMTVELVDSMGDDHSIARAARVSSGTTGTPDKDRGLINMLMRDRHGSPFEAVTFQFRIECPLFVAREFFRHRIASYNEVSGRYQEMQPVFYVPDEHRPLKQAGKPGAYKFKAGTPQQAIDAMVMHQDAAAEAWSRYRFMLDRGITREVARNVLPLSLYTSFYVTLNLRSLLNLLSLRWAHPDSTVPTFPLAEIEAVAQQIDQFARTVVPDAMTAFDKNGRVAP
ncbi:FAD-dependent thymidylate synthase [Streptomyces sp. LHD-70]|uniref:FAD-dependent thymidylate synthase n=1 Tax=Streptomyces sp. LHD-70 TaxID=3072140 RepID=UPI00280DF489|nr:FAD-dependent thymidylate synthase [Streptomyces sp. LHD-70]MDQ8703337.1 FAD-dependent thymidylate synthase [Streptomyces sp. LHD-70]